MGIWYVYSIGSQTAKFMYPPVVKRGNWTSTIAFDDSPMKNLSIAFTKTSFQSWDVEPRGPKTYSTSTLWLFNIAMENGPFIDDFARNIHVFQGFSMAMLVITRG